MKVEEVGLTAL